jgi:hypothetical protein
MQYLLIAVLGDLQARPVASLSAISNAKSILPPATGDNSRTHQTHHFHQGVFRLARRLQGCLIAGSSLNTRGDWAIPNGETQC